MGSPRGGIACVRDATLSALGEGAEGEPSQRPIGEHFADSSEDRFETNELTPGTRVGRYVIEGLVGRGAMGVVYAARDPDLARKVAVKVLRADALADSARQRMRARLLREAQAMARLSHPEVITVYDVGAFGEQLFVAMEYVEGDTLRHWRTARHRRYEEILSVYERAGGGLAAAHEAGLVHRDFKPDNVLVANDGRVRVTDFGLARRTARVEAVAAPTSEDERPSDQGLTLTLTRTGSLLGTPAYMAPEQLRGGVADARSDVFSFCVALYEALYGERPFGGSTMMALRSAIDLGTVRAAPVMTRVPAWLRGVLLHGMRALPEERYASMRELLDALRAAHAASQGRRWAIAVSVAVLGVAAVVGGSMREARGIARRDNAAAHAAREVSALVPAPLGGPTAPAAQAAPVAASVAPAALPVPAVREPTSSRRHGAVPAALGKSGAPALGNNGAFILE